MKEKELRKVSTCGLCNEQIGVSPLFMRVSVKIYGLKAGAIQRQQGLGMMLGGHGLLAQIMGSNEDLAEVIGDSEIIVCANCESKHSIFYEILELGDKDKDEQSASRLKRS